MKSSSYSTGLALKLRCSICILFISWCSCLADAGLFFRYWNADWSRKAGGNETNLGEAPYLSATLAGVTEYYNFILQYGAGNQWTDSSEQRHYFGAVTTTIDLLTMGVGLKIAQYPSEFNGTTKIRRAGPEFLIGYQIPFGDSGLGLTLAGNYGVYNTTYDTQSEEIDEQAVGYSFDPSIFCKFASATIRGGYRINNIGDDENIVSEKLSGGFVEFGFVW